jgi:hypothetical protein
LLISSPQVVRIRGSFSLVQAVRDRVQVVAEQARVDVQGHRRGGVPEHPLNRLDGRAGRHGEARRGVSQFVRSDVRQTHAVDVVNDPVRVYEALVREAPPRIDFLLPHATGPAAPGQCLRRVAPPDLQQVGGRRQVNLHQDLRVESLEQGGSSGTESLGVDNPTVAVIEIDGRWERSGILGASRGESPSQ